ncbi:MAG: HEAT repeat domain-containing protein, partial [Thermoguttaceae bacterium]
MSATYSPALFLRILCAFCGLLAVAAPAAAEVPPDPYTLHGQEQIEALGASDPAARSRAAEALGYMRYYPAEEALIAALGDDHAPARRNAALALGWCGGRRALAPLVARLDDADWNVRQSAWVALTNITGMEHPFDALAERSERLEAIEAWQAWCDALPERSLPADVLELIGSDRHRDVQRGVRAAGALGANADAVARIEQAVGRWTEIDNENDAAAKWRVQAGIRALGRSGRPEALPVLVRFLNNTQWSRYAADALGDLGGEEAAAALLAAFPRYARPAGPGLHRESTHRAPGTHPTDAPHLDSRDRILAAPYAIALSLSRIPFRNPDSLEILREHAPLIVAQVPLDIDGLMVYDEEPFQRIFRYLLERAGVRQSVLDAAFAALGQPRPEAEEAEDAAEEDAADKKPHVQSPVLRGLDAPHRIEANVEGWTDLYLVVDDVDDYFMDRANWAEAKLIGADGEETFLDTLEPVSAEQQHDKLQTGRSASFDDLRIGQERFKRGLHTHAVSVIHYKLGGRYRRFEAQVGVCASRSAGQGSVRFIVSPEPVEQRAGMGVLLADAAFASNVILALCRDTDDVPRLVALMDHENHWVRINATRTLMFLGADEAVEAIGERLRMSPPEGAFGFFDDQYFARAQGQDEFNDPAPRYREAFIMALGHFRAEAYVPLLAEILFDDRNALGIQYRAANALDRIGTPEAVEALREAEFSHPYHSVRMAAREGLWRRGVTPRPRPAAPHAAPPRVAEADIPERPTRFVFIKADPVPYNPFQIDSWRQAYMTTDSGPTYRPGRNLYVLDISGGQPRVAPLTTFEDGYVADCEVSYDGRTVLFARRTGGSPWWHVYEIGADGTGLRQLTDGPYHDVHPVPMPNGRIAFSTTRLGTRDEYHGYLCTGLATMHPDGTDIQVIGMNFGRDAEPSVAPDGRLLFTRLELFYSRMKTEFNLLAAHPDGTRMHTLYGPERRGLWGGIHGGYAVWARSGARHRQLRLTQPHALRPGEYLLTTPAGPILTQGRQGERFL